MISSAGSVAGRPLAVEVLQEPSFRRLWASGLCVNVARWMDLVTLGWLALQFTGSPFMVGVAAFARAAPLMVVGPFTGSVADRVPRGRILLVAQATGMVTALVLATIFGSGRGGYGVRIALEIVFGLVWALDFPARRTALYALLGAGRAAQAVSLETVSMQFFAKVLGPLAAGWCLAQVGPVGGFALMAVADRAGGLPGDRGDEHALLSLSAHAAGVRARRARARPGRSRRARGGRRRRCAAGGARDRDATRGPGLSATVRGGRAGWPRPCWSRSRSRAGCPCA